VGAGGDDALVDGVDDVEGFGRVAGDDLQDVVEATLLVAGVDALGGIADVEVGLPFEAGRLFEDGDANVFGDAGIDGRLIDDDVALLEGLAEGLRSPSQRLQVGGVAGVDRRGDGDDVEVRLLWVLTSDACKRDSGVSTARTGHLVTRTGRL
jgi:hypothetical protein